MKLSDSEHLHALEYFQIESSALYRPQKTETQQRDQQPKRTLFLPSHPSLLGAPALLDAMGTGLKGPKVGKRDTRG